MTTLREAARMALDALDRVTKKDETPLFLRQVISTAEALRAALAAKEPEPVAWMAPNGMVNHERIGHFKKPLYVVPLQREWQGLTDEDLSVCDEDGVILARYWEAKLKEKNK